jgi:hypothetical protein
MATSRRRLLGLRLAVPTVAVVLALTLTGCAKARNVDGEVPLADDDDITQTVGEDDEPVEDEPVEDDVPVDADDDTAAVFDDAEPFVGTTVTVTGTVDEVADRNAFEIAAEGRGDAGFLVLVADPNVALGEVVEVTGTVRRFDPAALSTELDFEIDPDLYSPADPQHVIVADRVRLAEPNAQ